MKSTTSKSSADRSIRTDILSSKSNNGPSLGDEKQSSLAKTMDKIRAKVNGSEKPPSDPAELEKSEAKALEKQRRKDEYERLGLGHITKYGMPGAGNWNA